MNTSASDFVPACAAAVQVERRHSSTLAYEAFLRDYVATNRPVVVEDAVCGWPALDKWTPDFFKTRFGSREVDVGYGERMTFANFIDGVLASREDAPGPYMYRLFIGRHLPELLPDVWPQNPYAFPRRLASPLMLKTWRRPDGYLKLLIGGIGGRFPVMHYDLDNMHAAVTEIHGEKAFVLYPPEDGRYLYPNPATPNKTLIKDIDDVDLERFPLFAQATRHQTILRPGDMVFVPSRWWHAARVLTPSVSVCQNMVDGSNWSGYLAEVCAINLGGRAWKRLAKKIYLGALGAAFSIRERNPRMQTSAGGVSRRVARLLPCNSAEAGDPSAWPMHKWLVE